MSTLQAFRLTTGGQIDRARSLEFVCNGERYSGFAGDTLASALLANGVRVLGRSFKYHRPRGLLSAGVEEPNALFRVDTGTLSAPLVRATSQPLLAGLVATTENAWPSVEFDCGRLLDFTHWLWPAGFYHKTFKWPRWHWYEGFIRRAAGSGRLPVGSDPTAYFQHNLHCDVLIVGTGPAGLAAALAAGRSGARVLLVEQEPVLGGSLRYESGEVDARPALDWLRAANEELAGAECVRVLTNTMVAGYFDHNVLLAVDRSHVFRPGQPVERLWKLRARQVVLATGAIEQPLVFANNDRPGIMLAGAVRRYLAQFAVAVGRTVVVATNNDDAYRTAFALQAAGITVPAIVDARRYPLPQLASEAAARAIEIIGQSVLTDSVGTRGVREVEVSALSDDGRSLRGARRTLACDAVAVSGGWSPTVHLYSQAGGKLRYRDDLACFVPERCRQQVRVAGAANGSFSLSRALGEGTVAGCEAARDAGFAVADIPAPASACDDQWSIRPIPRTPGGASDRQWVDFRHDVTARDIELAVSENYVSVEHLKRYTTTGMSVDQGKTSNLNALALLAELTDRAMAGIGTTTFRPVYSPVSLGAIAAGVSGELYSPTRLLPAHDWHIANGADFDEYGGWQRPACYRRPGEDREAAIHREALAVRNSVGLFDGSPLGKIEVKGPDAAEFLDRLYLNNMLSLPPGRARYGLMLNENGVVLDDGVCVCMAPEHYLVCTTSAAAERVTAWLEEWQQCEWPQLRFVIAPVTTQWAVLTLAGPRARELLSSIDSDMDFSSESLPHLGFASGCFAGNEARVQRVSFSGELSFEISVPARRAEALWAELMHAGAGVGIEPVGVEAILVLRLEKGFLHVGVDTDGTTNPLDLGFGGIMAKKQRDFVGRRSLSRPNDQRADRRQLVGLEPVSRADRLTAGAHLVLEDGRSRRSIGFVTSAALSPTLGRSIGLALLERGFERKGETVTVFDDGRSFAARVVAPAFYDPRGDRLRD